MSAFVLTIELLGTAAFAIAGAMLALRHQMDLFGVVVIGLISATGGGVLRDVLLGYLPPTMFVVPTFALEAIALSALVFLPAVHRLLAQRKYVYDHLMLIADSLGLGVFTAAGVSAAFAHGYGENYFFAVFLGTITGVGGGVIRDTLVGLPPYIFVKHVYATAVLIGAMLCAALIKPLGETWSMTICLVTVFTIRMLAAHYHWSLPKSDLPPEPEN